MRTSRNPASPSLKVQLNFVRIAACASAGLILAACEQPLRPANPTPMEVAAEHFGVPVSTLLELERITNQVRPPADGLSRPDPLSPQALRLMEIAAKREKTRSASATP